MILKFFISSVLVIQLISADLAKKDKYFLDDNVYSLDAKDLQGDNRYFLDYSNRCVMFFKAESNFNQETTRFFLNIVKDIYNEFKEKGNLNFLPKNLL
jgi:hypothetical protein